MADLPVGCTLSPEALNVRRAILLKALFQRASEHIDLPNGCRLRFAGDSEILLDIARMVEAERHCCRFLQFTIAVDADGGPITLDLSGPPGTREFLQATFDLP
jgi:hypothetical protein